MAIDQLTQYLSDGGYLLLFVLSVTYALRWRSQLGVDIALFFGAIAAVVVLAIVSRPEADSLPRAVVATQALVIMALPYLLLRLLRDLDGVATVLMRGVETGLALSAAVLFVFAPPYPGGVVLLLVGYFVAVQVYVFARFLRAARASRGITRSRLYCVATGSLLVAAIIFLAGIAAFAPGLERALGSVTAMLGLGSAAAYYVGFATPRLLKRAWRAMELREFVELSSGAAGMEQMVSSHGLVEALEQRVAGMVGANHAVIILWDEAAGSLTIAGEPIAVPSQQPRSFFAQRVFREQQARFTADAARDDPANAEVYRTRGARAIFAAPITFGERRLGVLAAYGPRPSLFAEDDLALVRVLAGQIAGFLVFRDLLRQATEMQAQERANALREEFLAAAAHDLKTPLTVVVGEVQLLQRAAGHDPALEPWRERLEHVNEESLRMRRLINELLDASRGEHEGFVREREPVDLGRLARETAARPSATRHRVAVDASSVLVTGDAERLRQVVSNLLENAGKYSPAESPILLRVEASGAEAMLSVTDQGIGIPDGEREAVFERFRRGSNLNGERSGGMGIGLYLCRRIVEEHGGDVSLQSRLGVGTTVTVTLPLLAASPESTPSPLSMEGAPAYAAPSAGGGR
ncbi:MAG: ATP-binding protein [Dehalococcoidia bacterium]